MDKQTDKTKTKEDFLNSLKGKDGQDGQNGVAADVIVKASEKGKDINEAKFVINTQKPEMTFVGDSNIKTSIEKDNTVKIGLQDTITVQTLKVSDIVTINKKGIDIAGLKMDENGIDMNHKTISHIADGKKDDDAVNLKQLKNVQEQIGQYDAVLRRVADESREGDALGSALAALKPLDYDPLQRSQIMAGIGYYRGMQAVALGVAHYTNEDTLWHGGMSYAGTSHLMANIGVSRRFGNKGDSDIRKKRKAMMPVYAEGAISSIYVLQDEVQTLRRENQLIRKENEDIRKQNEEANERMVELERRLDILMTKMK